MNIGLSSSLKRTLWVSLFSFVTLFAIQLAGSPKAHAAYDSSRLIDDSVFLDARSMGSGDIQNFFSGKGAGLANMNFLLDCDLAGSQAKQIYQSLGAPCGQQTRASNIIYYATQVYGVSPRVILATMQKEQGVATDPSPDSWQINQAMGYACPTSGSCEGGSNFFYQIDNGTWALRYHYERARGNNSWWHASSSWTCGTAKPSFYTPNLYPKQNVNFIDPYSGIQYTTVYIQNAATSAFYCYTPHVYNNHNNSPHPNEPKGSTRCFSWLPAAGDRGRCYTGSYNFVHFFELWFGSTSGLPYAWNIESFTYSGGDNSIPKGQTETLTLRARNIGTVPWYNHGSHPVRLGTWEPPGRISPLFNASKLTTVQESVVLPNEIGTFVFSVTPQTTGTFAESLNLVAENSQWAYWPGFRPTIVVPSPYQWQIQNVIYEKATGMMDPGTQQLITVIAKNTGGTTWSKSSGPSIRMGTWQPQRQSAVGQGWISTTRAAEMNETTVAPGQNAGFQFYVRMPASGQFYERLNLVAEGQAWFNDLGFTLYLHGTDYTWGVESINYSKGTGVMAPGSTQTITVKAKNTGTATWRNDSAFPVKLGTWQPQRQSQVSAAWSSTTRMATLSEASVAPGAVGTFTATVTMPSPGIFYEQMNLVAEGLKWFNNPGLMFYLEGRNP